MSLNYSLYNSVNFNNYHKTTGRTVNILSDIKRAISNTHDAINKAIERQNITENQYNNAKIESQSAHEYALKAALKSDQNSAMEALFQELVQEKFANILQFQIKEQAAVVELLNNNLATLIAVQMTLEEKNTENNPVLNKNIQSYSSSFSENFDQDLENKELSSEDVILKRVKKVISEQSSVEIENINLDHSLVLGQCFGSFLSSSNNHTISSNDFNMYELDTVELLMAIEEEFEIEISDAEAEMVRTVQELVNIISFKLNQKQI